MVTRMEQEIINKVKEERKRNKLLRAYPPYEQDNIPNSFDVLSDDELNYLMNNRHLLKLIE